MEATKQYIQTLKKAWRDEKVATLTYRAAAEMEKDPKRKEIFQRMSAEEDKHAARWEKRLGELGVTMPPFKPTLAERLRLSSMLQRGTTAVADVMENAEQGADGLYDTLIGLAPTQADRDAFAETRAEENGHDTALSQMGSRAARGPGDKLEGLLGKERWHIRGGGWIGQAIYGINDGLGAAFGIVSGVAGATHVNSSFVLLSGFASMIASALSMGSGAYLATKSEREVFQSELEKERQEINENPEEEREELELFYQLKGFSEEQAKSMASHIAKDPQEMLKILAHEELGLI